ncbi:DgyrCDS1233 [Dimorphilus gyrociliatus]|uniref:DgyrCDS1233 n=1 Tax=Dimorphilus gyrociliatus TaxID=2664684 RepID=A0A7I8V9T4_9ANNE|nr:DgyrCDS1233 [Dimorphilus gyrociliatus]
MKAFAQGKRIKPNVPLLCFNEISSSTSDGKDVSMKINNEDDRSQQSNEEASSYLCDQSFSEASEETVSNSLSPEPMTTSHDLTSTITAEEINFLPLKDANQTLPYQMDIQNPGVMIYYEEQLNDREGMNVTINQTSNFKDGGCPFTSSPKDVDQTYTTISLHDGFPNEMYHNNSTMENSQIILQTKTEKQEDESEVYDLTRIKHGLNVERTLSSEEAADIRNHDELERFPTKLWKAANDPNSEVIVWTEDGKSVEIEPAKFDREVMSKHPRLVQVNRFENMRRQMREYGFVWDEQQDGKFIFKHMFFRRGRKDLLRNVQTRRRRGLISGSKSFNQGEQPTSKRGRKPGKSRKSTAASKPDNEATISRSSSSSKCNWTATQAWYGDQYIYDNTYGNSSQAYYVYPSSAYGTYQANYNNSTVTTSHNTICTTEQPISELQQF